MKKYKFPDEINSTIALTVDGIALAGCEVGNLYAMNLDTGEIVWRYATGGGIHSSPAISNGMVYIGSKDGVIYAFGS